jgi:uncharacterized protein (TIGR03437 family)
MQRKRKIFIAKTVVVMAAIPVIIIGHEFGPDAGKNGVPGESLCTEAGCHIGTANSGPGSVSVAFPNGLTYTPGVKQHLTVTIADPNQRAWGFQLTARQTASSKAQAGSFTSTDRFTLVMCAASNLSTETELDFPNSQVCPSTQPLAYIEHSFEGEQRFQSQSQTYAFDWTPPATDVGNVIVYVAGNAANGDRTASGDRIYTKTYTLAPAANTNQPQITSDSAIVNGASFQPGFAPGSWVTITGSNLSSATDTWDKSIVNGNLPTALDGVSVSIGSKPAYVRYVSPTQINVQAPDVGAGPVAVQVTNSSGASNTVTANAQTYSPAFFLWSGKYAIATRQDFSYVAPAGLFPGVTTVPAKPGDIIILWGTGFGPTTPAVSSGIQVPADKTYSTPNPTVTIDGTPATVFGSALAPSFAGLYQVAIQVPTNARNGDLAVKANINGVDTPDNVFLTVQQ